MLNIQEDSRDIYFIDLDGTMLVHNYDPDGLDDAPLPGAIEFLNKHRNDYLVFTTSRKEKHALSGIRCLLKHGFMPKEPPVIMCNLPKGVRTVVNDTDDKNKPKAKAISLIRNRGIKEDD